MYAMSKSEREMLNAIGGSLSTSKSVTEVKKPIAESNAVIVSELKPLLILKQA